MFCTLYTVFGSEGVNNDNKTLHMLQMVTYHSWVMSFHRTMLQEAGNPLVSSPSTEGHSHFPLWKMTNRSLYVPSHAIRGHKQANHNNNPMKQKSGAYLSEVKRI